MPVPRELGDGTAHRVADSDEAVYAHDVGQDGHVIGAVRQPKAGTDVDALAVASVVEG